MTLFEKLQAAGLPVISATEDGQVTMGVMTDEQRQEFQDILLEHFQASEYAELQASRINLQNLKDEYLNMIARLEQIQNAINPTNAQVIQAIKDEALYIERIMKVVRRLV